MISRLTHLMQLSILNHMVNHSSATLNLTFSALSDPTRRSILSYLAEVGETSVTSIAEQFDWSLPNISKHLRVLEKAGLVKRRKEGRVYWFSLVSNPLKEATDWLAFYRTFWDDSLDALSELVEGDDT